MPRMSVRRATAWGAIGLLTLAGALPWAAERLPTRRGEIEDAWATRSSIHDIERDVNTATATPRPR